MRELSGFAVVSTEQGYAFACRDRRMPLGHWPLCGLFAVVAALRLAATGTWADPIAWTSVAFWPGFALLINAVAALLPKTIKELRIDAHGITVRMGRNRTAYSWEDVLAVRARQVVVLGRDQRFYGPHVRLRPGVPEPGRVFRGRDGWYLVLPLALRAVTPPDVAEAFVRFSGGRWQG